MLDLIKSVFSRAGFNNSLASICRQSSNRVCTCLNIFLFRLAVNYAVVSASYGCSAGSVPNVTLGDEINSFHNEKKHDSQNANCNNNFVFAIERKNGHD